MRVSRRTPMPATRVRDLMTTGLVTTHPNESLADVAVRMRDQGVGAVAIMENDELIGIITERDLSRATADGLSPRVTPASAYMTSGPFTIDADEEAGEAASTMAARGIRHLPVTEGGRVVGLVSARDLLLSNEPAGTSPSSRTSPGEEAEEVSRRKLDRAATAAEERRR